MRFDLSDEERAIREAVQGLCRAVYEQRASKMAGASAPNAVVAPSASTAHHSG